MSGSEWVDTTGHGTIFQHRSGAYSLRHELDEHWNSTSNDRWYVVVRPTYYDAVLAGPLTLDAGKVWVLARLYGEGKL